MFPIVSHRSLTALRPYGVGPVFNVRFCLHGPTNATPGKLELHGSTV